MEAFDERELGVIRGWAEYLADGGMDRPADAVPFKLMDVSSSRCELVEFLAGVLTLAVLSSPEDASRAVACALSDPDFAADADEQVAAAVASLPLSDALERLEATDRMLSESAALVALLGMWNDGEARPLQPGRTLRGMVLDPDGVQWDFSPADD
jgi:hypothetical protein